MAKLTAEEFNKKYSEKITDNDDLLIELMEDATDSIEPQGDNEEIAKLQSELESVNSELADLKEKYKQRFLMGSETEETSETESTEEPSEEEVIDIKEI